MCTLNHLYFRTGNFIYLIWSIFPKSVTVARTSKENFWVIRPAAILMASIFVSFFRSFFCFIFLFVYCFPSFFFSFFISYLPSPNAGLTPPGLTTQMTVDQISAGEAQTLNQNTRQKHIGGPPWNLWPSECQGQRQHRTKHKGHAQSQDRN